MAAEAALRTGAGLTSVATRAAHAGLTPMIRPEIMCRGVETNGELAALLRSASVAAIGPGLGQDGWARRVLARALDSRLPLVVDADALNLLAQEPIARGDWVLTPHPGEAARLLGCKTSAVQDDRPEAARRLAREFDAVVVLKGAGTLVATPSGALWLTDTGNPGMASGGMGDTLTGVIAGLLAQTADPALAARLGVWIHGRAADLAAADGERGLAASDLLPHVRRLVNP
jgi:NAD(P)H-hydrate epimerase